VVRFELGHTVGHLKSVIAGKHQLLISDLRLYTFQGKFFLTMSVLKNNVYFNKDK
jgi:hypothetical protein